MKELWSLEDDEQIWGNSQKTYNLFNSLMTFQEFSSLSPSKKVIVDTLKFIMEKEWAQGDKNWPSCGPLKSTYRIQ